MTTIDALPLLGRRWRFGELIAADTVLAVVLALLCSYAAMEGTALVPVAWLTGVLIGGPLAVRRRWPVVTAVVTIAASAAALTSGIIPAYAAVPPSAAVAFALYMVGAAVPRRASILTLTGGFAAMVCALTLADTSASAEFGGAEVGFACLAVGAGWVLGRATRDRRASAASRLEQATQQAVIQERLRIARELHDIVAHSMSLIAVKAAVANHVAELRPQEAGAALRVIESTSRAALAELRHAVGALRGDEAYTPTPGLAGLARLAEQAASSGVEVHLEVRGEAELPEGVGVSAYRIVQESLTNVIKHAAPARCEVTVTVGGGECRIEVTDDGRRPPADPARPGHGLVGMRERVAVYGGALDAGPLPAGGFRVAACLPYGEVP
ncbi:signal transduction histidine kinase [Allocatelliglobosispora scoriae]|uniref:histidine kinase n=1 Tax=Allocatelliglobosispora scoriae TaxID=643052 RepID=A0A841BIJ6_9ACTN|nr:sensor histidine kinase [Allocatelliglobosispora scoriae]MBB5867148.1 signal transduction histidine kinase [Allocatelliglobosispora scoriae]